MRLYICRYRCMYISVFMSLGVCGVYALDILVCVFA